MLAVRCGLLRAADPLSPRGKAGAYASWCSLRAAYRVRVSYMAVDSGSHRASSGGIMAENGPVVSRAKDFFVTYNGKDESWATWIAATLETAGYTTTIQAWD